MSRIKLHVPLEVDVVLKQFAVALSHLYEEAMVRKDMLCSNVKHRQRQNISSTWGYEGLQPWPPPCSLRTRCLFGKGVMLCTLALAAAQACMSNVVDSFLGGKYRMQLCRVQQRPVLQNYSNISFCRSVVHMSWYLY